ncbi:MAG: hypothetical protein JW725_04675 [Candidatus Babeliaceae bacterium]|nr:hypothetical protein [Candidatus Babeliaceae bacterium]
MRKLILIILLLIGAHKNARACEGNSYATPCIFCKKLIFEKPMILHPPCNDNYCLSCQRCFELLVFNRQRQISIEEALWWKKQMNILSSEKAMFKKAHVLSQNIEESQQEFIDLLSQFIGLSHKEKDTLDDNQNFILKSEFEQIFFQHSKNLSRLTNLLSDFKKSNIYKNTDLFLKENALFPFEMWFVQEECFWGSLITPLTEPPHKHIFKKHKKNSLANSKKLKSFIHTKNTQQLLYWLTPLLAKQKEIMHMFSNFYQNRQTYCLQLYKTYRLLRLQKKLNAHPIIQGNRPIFCRCGALCNPYQIEAPPLKKTV